MIPFQIIWLKRRLPVKSTMVARTYRHIDITIRNGSKLYVVNRRKANLESSHHGSYKKLTQAINRLQQLFPEEHLTKASLRITKKVKKFTIALPKRKYAKVYYQGSRKGLSKWLQHEAYGGRKYHKTEQAAAEAVAEFLGCGVEELLLKKSSYPIHTVDVTQEIFGLCYTICGGCMPGDALDMKSRAESGKAHGTFQKQPGIIASFIITKLPVAKDVLLQTSREIMGKPSASKLTDLALLHAVLVRAAVLMTKLRWPHAWTESVGKGVIRFQNFWEHLVKLGVLARTAPVGQAAVPRPLIFCETQEEYFVVPFSQCKKSKLLSQITWGKACLQQERISSWKEYTDASAAIDTACPELAGALDEDGYMRKWLNRGWLIYAMWRGKHKRLNITGCTVRSFLPLFPDAKERLLPLLSPGNVSTNQIKAQMLSDALSNLKYTGPPELLSMWACLFADPEAVGLIAVRGVAWLRIHVPFLQKARKEYERAHGISPHLAVLLKQFVKA